ncbi:MAG: single-stranded DNA-binding protein [Ruminococcaceae bacterium]|nr:single-stranded DNA-binding protein [Oscillospiraceae bacterium]
MANFNFNKVILGGRLTADPELRQTPQGIAVTSFSIAVNRPYSKNQEQQQADFINCVAWRSTAEFITRFFKKGSSICVTGSIQTRSWTDQQGQKRYATDVVVSDATFVDSRTESGHSAPAAESYGAPAFSSIEDEAPKFEELSSDDDLPF